MSVEILALPRPEIKHQQHKNGRTNSGMPQALDAMVIGGVKSEIGLVSSGILPKRCLASGTGEIYEACRVEHVLMVGNRERIAPSPWPNMLFKYELVGIETFNPT